MKVQYIILHIKAAYSDGRDGETQQILRILAFPSLPIQGHRGRCLKSTGLELTGKPWRCFEMVFLRVPSSQGYRISSLNTHLKILWFEHCSVGKVQRASDVKAIFVVVIVILLFFFFIKCFACLVSSREVLELEKFPPMVCHNHHLSKAIPLRLKKRVWTFQCPRHLVFPLILLPSF